MPRPLARSSLVPISIIALLFSLVATLTVTQGVAAQTELISELSGAEEVPGPGDPDGFGFSSVQVDPATGEVCAFVEVSDIAAATAAHIHQGAAGVAGPIVVTLPTPSAEGFGEGCVDGLDPVVLQAIVDDPAAYYVNVHTADFPAGAIRGQLRPPPVGLFARLSGADEIPGPGDPDGNGRAFIDVDVSVGRVCGFGDVQNIAVATAAHIHEGAAGVAGPIVVTLPTPDADGFFEGCVDGLDPVLLQAIVDDPTAYYVNVHTADYPAGAIRGQLGPPPITVFAGPDGASEVPGPGDPDGTGFVVLDIEAAVGRICGFLEVSGIAAATAAHIHQGAEGVAGPIVVTLPTPNADGFAEGCVDGLDPVLLQAIADAPEGYYVNVHTADYPAGAVRGQLSFEPPPSPPCTPPELCTGPAAPGDYVYDGFNASLSFTLEQEWFGQLFPEGGFALNHTDLPAALYALIFTGEVLEGTCGDTPATIEATPEGIIDWLAAHPDLGDGTPTPASVGGAQGMAIDITGSLPAGCDTVALLPPLDDPFFVFEGERVRFIAVDVEGQTVLFAIDAFVGDAFEEFLPDAEGVLGSMVFALGGGPGPTPTPPATIPDTATSATPATSAPSDVAPVFGFVLAGGLVSYVALRRRRARAYG